MGGVCSRSSNAPKESLYAKGRNDFYGSVAGEYKQHEFQVDAHIKLAQPQERKSLDRQSLEESKQIQEPIRFGETGLTGYGSSDDDFYDGIPRFRKTLSQKSRSFRSKQTAKFYILSITRVQSSHIELIPLNALGSTWGFWKFHGHLMGIAKFKCR
ncbi:unnamed protein product [Ilex paraguariensis]|uniref:Uncharacterized protein n=1 Tax=Ilex paraguariensis TaxID=185542 RepID=A0ABC8UTR5_9AQUA